MAFQFCPNKKTHPSSTWPPTIYFAPKKTPQMCCLGREKKTTIFDTGVRRNGPPRADLATLHGTEALWQQICQFRDLRKPPRSTDDVGDDGWIPQWRLMVGFGGVGSFRWKWMKSKKTVARAIQRCMVFSFFWRKTHAIWFTLERYEIEIPFEGICKKDAKSGKIGGKCPPRNLTWQSRSSTNWWILYL